MEEATTDSVSVPLAQLVAILATEAEEEVAEAVAMISETAEAMEVMRTIPALIICPLMELMSLIPSTVSPQTNGTSLAAMIVNRFSACTAAPTLSGLLLEEAPTVSSLLLEEAEAVKEEAGAMQLWPWRPGLKAREIVSEKGFSCGNILGELIFAHIACQLDMGHSVCLFTCFSESPHKECFDAPKGI